jgi:hypothetical protein
MTWDPPRVAEHSASAASASAGPRSGEVGTPRALAQRIHPYERSFGYYVRVGYEIATGIRPPPHADAAIDEASNVDAAILIIDDIIDESENRAGRPSMHREIGVKDALAEAMIIECDAVGALHRAMDLLETPMPHRVEALGRLNELHHCIYIGQRLDLAARRERVYRPELIDRYFELIHRATSSHVRTGMEIGQLLAGRRPESSISAIADEIGVIRQICDDFNDYFPDHHDPFGDFVNGLNRLPELLFLAAGGRREPVLRLLEDGCGEKARLEVLTSQVRGRLHRYCQDRIGRMMRPATPFDYSELIQDYGLILTR